MVPTRSAHATARPRLRQAATSPSWMRRVCPLTGAARAVEARHRPGQVGTGHDVGYGDRTDGIPLRSGHEHQRRRGGVRVNRHRTGDIAVHRARRLCEVRRQRHRLATGGGRHAGQAAQVRRQGGAQEGDVGQTPAELLGDDGDLDRRCPRTAVLGERPQLAPAGRVHRRIELAGPLAVVEVRHGADAEAVDDLRRGATQRALLR